LAKVVEVTAASPESFEDAIRKGLAGTAHTVENIQGAWIKEQKVVVERDTITEFRVDMKVTFIVRE